MNKSQTKINDFVYGFKKGTPILLGYIPVAFTFGLMAVAADFIVNGSVYFPDQPYQRRAVCRYKFNYPGCGLS